MNLKRIAGHMLKNAAREILETQENRPTCRFQSCNRELKPEHDLCTEHWKMRQAGTINKCPNCPNYKPARYPLCVRCNNVKKTPISHTQQPEARNPAQRQAGRKYDAPQGNTFAQRSAMLEEDQKAKDKRQLFHDQQMKCIYCGNVYKYNELEIEHIIPKKLGGPDHIRNSQLACKTCNQAKGVLTDIEFRQRHRGLLPQKERTPANPPINPALMQ